MSSAEVVCWNSCLTLLTNLSIEANRVDPEQTAPIGAVWSTLSTLFAIEYSSSYTDSSCPEEATL